MNLISTPPLVTAVLFLLLGVFIFLSNKKSRVNLAFFLVCFSTAWWQLSWFFLFNSTTEFWINNLVRIGYMGIIMIPVVFFHFFVAFLDKKNPLDKALLVFSYSFLFIFEILLLTSDYFISGYYDYGWGFYPKAGIVHPVYLSFLFLLLFRIIYLLRQALIEDKKALLAKQNNHRYKQTKYLLWGIVFYGAASLDFLVNYGVNFYPFGFVFIIIFTLFIAYAIIKEQFLDIRAIATEMISIFLVLVALFEIFMAQTTLEVIFRLALFMVMVVFAILLIKSVSNEVRRREEMEILTKKLQKTGEQLQKANKELQRLDEAKSEFLSIASHQLRTPTTVIKGYISMMQEGSFGKVPKILKENLDKVYIATERLLNLIESLLDISRIEAGRLEFDIQPTDLGAIAKATVEDFKPKAKAKKLKLEIFSPADLPKVKADTNKVKEVISNLIDNAVKYTKAGEISVGLHQEGTSVVLSVQDTGHGVEPDDLSRLFNKFVRGNGMVKVHTEGTGLGLYFARKVIENMGGRIWAESPGKDRGSKFSFSLPLADKSKAPKIKSA